MSGRPIDPVLPGGNLSEQQVGMLFQTVVAAAVGRLNGRDLVGNDAVAAVAAHGEVNRYFTDPRATNEFIIGEVNSFIRASVAGDKQVLVLNRLDRTTEADLRAAARDGRAHQNPVTHWTVLCLEKNADGSLAVSYADSVRPGVDNVIPPQISDAVNSAATALGVGVGFRPFQSVMQTGANCGYYAVWNAMRMLGFERHVEADPEQFVARQRAALMRGEADGGLPDVAPQLPPEPRRAPPSEQVPPPLVPPRATVPPSAAEIKPAISLAPKTEAPPASAAKSTTAATTKPAASSLAPGAKPSVAAKDSKKSLVKKLSLDGPLGRRITRVREDLYRKYKAPALRISEEVYNKIYRDLVDADDDKFEELYAQYEDIFAERKLRVEQYENVLRQQDEIRRGELINSSKPGTYNLKQLIDGHESMLPISGEAPNWEEGKHGYHRDPGSHTWSFLGGTEEEYQRIINDKMPRVWTTMPPTSYRNAVFDAAGGVAGGRTLDELRVSDERIRILLEEGREATPKELKKVRKFNPFINRVSNVAESAVGAVNGLVNVVGRGVISESSVPKDRRYREYKEHERRLLATLAHRMAPSKEIYEQMMLRINEFGDLDDELFNETTISRLGDMVLALARDSGKFSEEQLKAAEKELREREKQFYEGLKKIVGWEDRATMLRYLNLCLLLIPVGGFTPILSEFFTWTDFLEVFGPIFDSSKGFFQGLADVAKSSSLGPIGEAADVLGVDDTINFIGDLPIISIAGDAIDLMMDNSITTNLFSALRPLLGSPLIPLYVAGVYSLVRFEKELTHHLESKKFTEEQKKAIEDLAAGISKKMDGSAMLPKVEEFVKRKGEIEKQVRLQVACARFIAKGDFEALKIFDEFTFGPDGGSAKHTLSHLSKAGGAPIDEKTALKMLLKHPKSAEIIDKFSMLHACGYDLSALPSDEAARKASSEKGKEMIHREAIEKKAAEFDFRPRGATDAERFASLEAQIRQQEIDQMMEIVQMNIRSVDKPVAATAADSAVVPDSASKAPPAAPSQDKMNRPVRAPGLSPRGPRGFPLGVASYTPSIAV